MTQEQKDLLLKDLCARLPYEVKVESVFINLDTKEHKSCGIEVFDATSLLMIRDGLGEFKPYLFPLSSMTEEQAKEMQEIVGSPKVACIMRKTGGLELWLDSVDTDPTIWLDTIFEVQDWLNKNHFDYRGLIPKGLANDATGLGIY